MRKHLYFSINEWVALPWWQQRLYVDLLNEQLAADRGEEPELSPDQMATAPTDLAGLGFTVQNTPDEQ